MDTLSIELLNAELAHLVLGFFGFFYKLVMKNVVKKKLYFKHKLKH